MYVLDVISSSYRILSTYGGHWFISLQFIYLVSALVQVFGIASIGPFIAIVSNPEIIQSNPVLSYFYNLLGFTSEKQFITAAAFVSIGLILIANAIGGLTNWLSYRYAVQAGSSLQNELFEKMLRRTYLDHKMSDHNVAITAINQELPRFIFMVIQPLMTLFSQAMVALVILVGLLALNPIIALSAGAVVGLSYLATYRLLVRGMKRAGKITTRRHEAVQSILSEAFQGIKEIKLKGSEPGYVDRFAQFNKRGLRATAFISLAGDLPKLVIETISFAAILLFAAYLVSSDTDQSTVVGLLSIYGVAGYKLLPAMQQIYRSLTNLSAHGEVARRLEAQLSAPVEAIQAAAFPLETNIDSIALKQVSFAYPGIDGMALDSVSVTFSRGTLNTIAGRSGSGKSTLADIALGLLAPQSGLLMLNGSPLLPEQNPAYRASIGYVPQQIFITNDSILANVAFGIPDEEIDKARVESALLQANAMEFVQRLPNGMESLPGQDGKRLSGGQRQRIGIARALYGRAKVLVLDEPSSALDIESEHELMTTLDRLKREVLVIIISHRPAAIKQSENITLLDSGRVIANGSYAKLLGENAAFQSLMNMASANAPEHPS